VATPISAVEAECRLSIGVAYAAWLWGPDSDGFFSAQAYDEILGFHLVDYERAMGLDLPC